MCGHHVPQCLQWPAHNCWQLAPPCSKPIKWDDVIQREEQTSLHFVRYRYGCGRKGEEEVEGGGRQGCPSLGEEGVEGCGVCDLSGSFGVFFPCFLWGFWPGGAEEERNYKEISSFSHVKQREEVGFVFRLRIATNLCCVAAKLETGGVRINQTVLLVARAIPEGSLNLSSLISGETHRSPHPSLVWFWLRPFLLVIAMSFGKPGPLGKFYYGRRYAPVYLVPGTATV